MTGANFFELLQEVAHYGFMASITVMTGLTIFVVFLCVRRILPKHPRDDSLPRPPERSR
jgi:hypothetical protein